jgi:hypothetical protein
MSTADDFLYNTIMKSVADAGGLDNSYALLDSISRTMGAGAEFSRYSDMFFGLNRLPNLAPLPLHRELQGLVLFTRPNLNLSYDNISPVRQLAALMTQDPLSYQYAVRMMLDPTTYKTAKQSALVDNLNPYITLLTNSIMTMSSPPDIGVNIYSSPEGIAKETWIMNDSIAEYNGRFDLTCTFNNFKGNAVLALFHTWLLYMTYLRIGPIIPHPSQRIQNEMDYFTRIERFKLDTNGQKIVQWFHTGASVPTNLSIGAGFGFNREEAAEFENKQLSVTFTSVGAVYNDPIQLLEFNYRIARTNKGMQDSTRTQKYTKVPYAFYAATNYNGYPWIDLETNELQWWIENEQYKALTKGL